MEKLAQFEIGRIRGQKIEMFTNFVNKRQCDTLCVWNGQDLTLFLMESSVTITNPTSVSR